MGLFRLEENGENPNQIWVRGVALLGVLLIAVLLVMHGSRNLSLKEDVIPKISNPINFFIFNAVVTSFAVIPGAASATCVAAGVILVQDLVLF